MKDLLALTRAMNLFYHHLHNTASGVAFEGDHEMMLDFYGQLDDEYDTINERHQRLIGPISMGELVEILENSCEVLESIPEGDFRSSLEQALKLESILGSEINLAMVGASQGTINMLAQIADDSEVRCYKIGQRLK